MCLRQTPAHSSRHPSARGAWPPIRLCGWGTTWPAVSPDSNHPSHTPHLFAPFFHGVHRAVLKRAVGELAVVVDGQRLQSLYDRHGFSRGQRPLTDDMHLSAFGSKALIIRDTASGARVVVKRVDPEPVALMQYLANLLLGIIFPHTRGKGLVKVGKSIERVAATD